MEAGDGGAGFEPRGERWDVDYSGKAAKIRPRLSVMFPLPLIVEK
ncbi:hypothetical protein [Streptomyces scopuliridis]|nr:hypothetical protein [Streptomyces scopuliridis]